jgi:hypothetical protein
MNWKKYKLIYHQDPIFTSQVDKGVLKGWYPMFLRYEEMGALMQSWWKQTAISFLES